MPLYYEIKLLFIVWLINPGTRGAEVLYNKYLWKILRTYASKYDPTFKSDNAVRSGYCTFPHDVFLVVPI